MTVKFFFSFSRNHTIPIRLCGMEINFINFVIVILQTLLRKVAHGVRAILGFNEVDLITRMEVCEGVVSEVGKMFTTLQVTKRNISLFLYNFFPGNNVAISVIQ